MKKEEKQTRSSGVNQVTVKLARLVTHKDVGRQKRPCEETQEGGHEGTD